MKDNLKIAILTGGGDCPGINAVIRSVTKKAIIDYDMEVFGFEDGYHGLVNNNYRKLNYDDVSGILTLGGTILGTSKVANPYHYAVKKGDKIDYVDRSPEALNNIRNLGIDCLLVIGGDGSLGIANRLFQDGIMVVGIPKTIDNDIRGTDITFGFDTAVQIATDGIDRLHTTAQSHHRIMIIEVMGHNAGWIALHAGIAGGGDVILIPEIPYRIEAVADVVRRRNKKGRRFSIIVVAEGAKLEGGDVVISRIVRESQDPVRLGGIGFILGEQIENETRLETRTVVLGHLLRGGTPTAFDRVLATQLGSEAVEMVRKEKFGFMVGIASGSITHVPLGTVSKGPRTVPADHPLIRAARSIGTFFGE
ncbi:MAG: 6-phosphofructokinase [Spirochaetota bacterium]